jgi:hypothetical protein
MATKDISDLQVCQAYEEFWKGYKANPLDYKTAHQILGEMTGQHWKVCDHAMERANRREFIDISTSTNTARLTEKGKALIAAAEGRQAQESGK